MALSLTHHRGRDGERDVSLCFSSEPLGRLSDAEAEGQVAGPGPQDGRVREGHLQKLAVVLQVGVPHRLGEQRKEPKM